MVPAAHRSQESHESLRNYRSHEVNEAIEAIETIEVVERRMFEKNMGLIIKLAAPWGSSYEHADTKPSRATKNRYLESCHTIRLDSRAGLCTH